MLAKVLLFVILGATLFAQAPPFLSFGLVPAAQPAGLNAYSVVVGDFNGDGKPDLATGYSGAVTVVLGNGDGTFGKPISTTVIANPQYASSLNAMAVGDLNGDGKQDLVTFNLSNGQSLSVMLGNGDGTFNHGANYPVSTLTAAFAGPLVLADFNGDGHLDLAFVNTNTNAIDVMLGNGDGTFGVAASYLDSFATNALVAGDFNGDGRVDLLTISGSATSSGNAFTLLVGLGDGTFAPPTTRAADIPSTGSIFGSVAADFNGDGKLDVATTSSPNQNTTEIGVYLGNGDGSFAAPSLYPCMACQLVGIADVTGDGNLDIINSAQNGVEIIPGNGDGTFQGFALYAANSGSVSLTDSFASADLNGDGRIDLVLAGSPLVVLDGAPAPFLRASLTHIGDFSLGSFDPATFTLVVSNADGAETTNGTITVSDSASFSIKSLSGPGWMCGPSNNVAQWDCSRSDPLGPGASYPPITVTIELPFDGQPAEDEAIITGGGSARTEALDVATVLPVQTSCVYTFDSGSITIDPAGGSFSLPVITQPSCQWSVQNVNSWMSITTPAENTGNGTLSANVQPNTGSFSRFGGLNVTETQGTSVGIVVVQPQPGCTYQLSTASVTVPATGGSFSVNVSAGGCTWEPRSNASWISVTNPNPSSPGIGSGVASFAASANPDTIARTGTVSIAGQTVSVSQPASAKPGVSISSVSNAFGGGQIIAPNTWVAIKGTNLAPPGDSRIWQASDFVNGQMPTQLDGVSVTVNAKSAYIYYISPTQLNILTPPDPLSSPVQIQVSNGSETPGAFTVQQTQGSSPSFFVFNGGPYVIGLHLNGTDIGPTSLYPGVTTPVKPGETVVLFANGFGPTSAAVVSGSSVQSGTLPMMPVITIGGIAATVQFAGLIAPGLYQFNVVVPASAPSGDNEIWAIAYDATAASHNDQVVTQGGVLINVQR
jgi:uncharacterized protein (TIGR03437 family)